MRPTAITFDESRNEICVTDAGSGHLQIFNHHGLDLFKTTGLSQLRQPMDAVVDDRGNFYFTEGAGGEIGRSIKSLNWLGEPRPFEIESPASDWRPEHLCLTPEGDLISLDRTNLVLCKHDGQDGSLVWIVSPWDASHGDVNRGGEVVLGRPTVSPDGRIYVPVSSYSRVMVLSEDGLKSESFGVVGTRAGQMIFPVDVAFGAGGRILVLDRHRQRLLAFDADHNFVAEFLGFGKSPGRVYFPSCLSASDEGLIFVGQAFEGRVQIYRIYDTSQGSLETPGPRVGWVAPVPSLLRIASGIRQAIGCCVVSSRAGGCEMAQGSDLDALLNVELRGNSQYIRVTLEVT